MSVENENNLDSSPVKTSSIIQADVHFEGEITFSGELHIYGNVTGNIASPIDSEATLVIQEGSTITGHIRSPHMVIAGHIDGDVFASSRLTLKSTAMVSGNIHYCALSMEPGSSINGMLVSLETPLE